VPINDVLRYAMYYENYGQQRVGMEEYARIPVRHSALQCVDCNAPCQLACPFEIPIKEKLLHADRLLRFV
jgi:predicted aldo/keto reductase-like oxidoreductase